tara:strand:+ start:2425 stop:3117 length:693 start_codon:yes stop_codon:yes gene_type:complete
MVSSNQRIINWNNSIPVIEKPKRQVINGKRHYIINNGEDKIAYPSVTTVLGCRGKAFLADWRKRVGDKEAKKITSQAAKKGTNMHNICESYLRNQQPSAKDMVPMAKFEFASIREYFDKIDNVYAVENVLWSHKLKMAGAVDCIAEYDGILSIIDFKTSRKYKRKEWITNYFAQTTAYAIMANERYGIVPKQLVIMIGNVQGGQVFVEKPQNYYDYLMESKRMYMNGESD